VVVPDDGIILDWCLRGSYGFGPPAIAVCNSAGAA